MTISASSGTVMSMVAGATELEVERLASLGVASDEVPVDGNGDPPGPVR